MFKKGNEFGKDTKRGKGKVASKVKELLLDLIEDQLDTFKNDLQELSAKDRLMVLSRFLPYILPKMKEVTDDDGGQKSVQIVVDPELGKQFNDMMDAINGETN